MRFRLFRSKPLRLFVSLVAVCVMAAAIAQVPQPARTPGNPPKPNAPPPYLTIMPTPPKDAAPNASMEELAKFAWQEFLALNWKASVDSRNPPGPGNQRGLPDMNWNYSKPVAAFPNPLVWQTYAQTTELRPNGPLITPWQNLGIPQYSYMQPPVPGTPRVQGGPAPVNNLWNNLDEDSEIGSCNIYGKYWQQNSPRDLVLFQVKVNRDEYEYLRTAYGQTQNCAPQSVLNMLAKQGIKPNYSNCSKVGAAGGLMAQAQASVVKNIKQSYVYYPGQKSTCSCPPGQAICLPCGSNSPGGAEGAIEVKSAWRRLLPNENKNRYYTTQALYYDKDAQGRLAYYNDTFALIGMHIIHKTVNYPHFIFATFEHVDVASSDMNYILTAPVVFPTGPQKPTGTEVGGPVPVRRQAGQTDKTKLHPVPRTLDVVTANVWQQLKSLNPSVIWQYYRLTGVQAQPMHCASNLGGSAPTTQSCITTQNPIQCTSVNPNYYMANFVIESDPFLNNFTGPGFAKPNHGPIFTPRQNVTGCENLLHVTQRRPVQVGGCQGCHGVGQTAFGTDFSFLLDFGHNKPAIKPAMIHYQAPQSLERRADMRSYVDPSRRVHP